MKSTASESLGGAFGGGTAINYNRINGSFRFINNKFPLAGHLAGNSDTVDSGKPEPPDIGGNVIDGSLTVVLPENIQVRRISFGANKVKADANFFLPDVWNGLIDLSNFQEEAGLRIEEYSTNIETKKDNPPPCGNISLNNDGPEAPLRVMLKGTETRVLTWVFPISCDHRWIGTGLRYKHWESFDPQQESVKPRQRPSKKNDEKKKSEQKWLEKIEPRKSVKSWVEQETLKRLITWGDTMAEPDLDAYITIANYLRSRGSLNWSRDVLRKVKRLNYLPFGDVTSVGYWSSGLVYVLLAPTGWGANPEWALVWLTLVWLLFTGFYKYYSCRQREQWALRQEKEQIAGFSRVAGFMQFDHDLAPKGFNLLVYSADAMLPVINLHAYDRFYPERPSVRIVTVLQHIIGWILLSVFLVSAAIL